MNGPVRLGPNFVRRAYRGGAAIAELRGLSTSEAAPEDWVGSTTSVWGSPGAGVSRLPDGRPLPDALAADPEGWLGSAHTARHGSDPCLLVKLLDAGQRLMVHCHPDRGFAARHLGFRYGKTEAWIIAGTRGPSPEVFLGFRQDVDPHTLERWVREQDGPAILAALNRVPVAAGQTFFIPAGLPHAIGEGLLIVELQEPTDLSVMLEWQGFAVDGAREGHLDLGFGVALQAVDRSAWTPERLRTLLPPRIRSQAGIERLLGEEAASFFRAESVRGGARLSADFALLIVLDGAGRLDGLQVGRGDTVLVPYSAGPLQLEGDLHAIRCLPPGP